MEVLMTTGSSTKKKLWQLTALTEALGDLVLPIEDKVSVGRGKDNDVVLGSKQISRQHAELTVVDDILQVTDLGSSNGTLVNDVQIEPNQPIALNLNDIVSFAVFSFKVEQGKVKVASAPVVDDSNAQQPSTETVEPKPTDTTAEPVKSSEKSTEEVQESITPETVEQISEERLEDALEAELSEPIPVGDPNQQPAPMPDDKDIATKADTPSENKPVAPNSKEHFDKLAQEADEDIHQAKQAATAKMSGTSDSVEKKSQDLVKERVDEKLNHSPNFSENFNTVSELEKHNVAHVKNSTPVPQTGKKGGTKTILWIALILLALVAALWLFNTGALL